MTHLPSTMKGSYLVIPSEGKAWKYAGTTGQDRWIPITESATRGGVLEAYQGDPESITGLIVAALIIALVAKG